MTDDTVINAQDPLPSDAVAKEASMVVKEGEAVECLTNAFERYIQNYQDSWQKDWQDGITAFEQEVENWQNSIAAFGVQTSTNQASTNQASTSTAQPAPTSTSTAMPQPVTVPTPAPKKNTPPSSGT